VPFILRAGKALNERKAEVRVQLRDVAGGGATFAGHDLARNELVLRLQPDEAVYFKTNMKAPGLSTLPQQVELDLSYRERFYRGHDAVYSPDAYARLLLETLLGRQAQFVRADELLESWKIWDPVLAAVDEGGASTVQMHKYPYGSRGPAEADALIARKGYVRNTDYVWKPVPSQNHQGGAAENE